MKDYWLKSLDDLFVSVNNLISYFLGGYDGLILTLTVFIIIEHISKTMYSIIIQNEIRIIKKGDIIKDILIYFIVGISNILDVNVIGNSSMLRVSAIVFYLSTLGIRILKRASYLGLPIPKKLLNILNCLHSKDQNNK